MSSIHTSKTGRELWTLCLQLSMKYGAVMDAQRFRNELNLKFYGKDAKAIFELGLEKRLYYLSKGNLFFIVNARKSKQA